MGLGVSMMISKIALATIAVVTITLPLAYAGETSSNTVGMTHPSATDLKGLTDARVSLIKDALQLTPDQQQYWPAVEEAIRNRADNRQARLQRLAQLRGSSPMEALRGHNPVEIMQRRAELLTQRGADLKKIADAWEPLYKTLTKDQKKRMAFVTIVTARAMRNTIERRLDTEDEDE
jgi:LTXXQ motif family protein